FGPAPDGEAYRSRYTVRAVEDRPRDRTYECNFCKTSWPLLSNRSLRAAYAWFKRQSVPFAACVTPGCKNEGVNVFEHNYRYRVDSAARPDLVRCRCKGRPGITLGEPIDLRGARSEVASRLEEVFRSARDRGGLRDRVNNLLAYRDYTIGRSRYLRTLRRLAPRLRDFHSYCNTRLLAEDYMEQLDRLFGEESSGKKPDALRGSPFNGVATLRTDAVSISLGKRKKSNKSREEDRDQDRHHLLQVQMTALRIDRSHKADENRGSTFFLLAAHPSRVLKQKKRRKLPQGDEPGKMFADAALPVADRQYDHLFHEGTDHGKDARLSGRASHMGAGVLFMRPDYAEHAHFMVLKDLTVRFRRLTLCMDGDKSAYGHAAAVFAEDLRTVCDDGGLECRRVEIAVLQAEARRGKRGVSPEEQDRICDRENERVASEWKERLAARLEEDGAADLGDEDRRLLVAKAKVELFGQVTEGGWAAEATWGWRKRPTQRGNRLLAALWLSQGPDRDGLPNGIVDEFLRRSSLQSVDTAIKGLRDTFSSGRRPESRAGGGQTYYRSSRSAHVAACQIWLYCFFSNYLKIRIEPRKQRAGLLGLVRGEDLDGFDIAGRLEFRLDWNHAIEITEETGHGQETLPRRRAAGAVLPAVGA
ncbi:MAG: hypothetical protein OXC11_16245, partial [Rhodospirillales bacterium]|nr:hypothetical protein [Rhodospirillales bacterium]